MALWNWLTRSRLGAALLCGLAVATYVAVSYAMRLPPGQANDLTVNWAAAQYLIAGKNPYTEIAQHFYPPQYFYPLTATFLLIPLLWLPIKVAATVLSATGATILAYFLGRDRWRLAVLLSAPMLSTAAAGQTTAFVTAAALTPLLGWTIALKPNVGLAVFAMKPSWTAVIGAAALGVLSLLLLPTWPVDWYRAVRGEPGFHLAPVSVPGGIVMVLAFLKWRRPEARMLGVLSLIPHTMTWYDALPIMLVPSTFRQLLILGILSHLASFVAAPLSLTHEGPALFRATSAVALWGLYFPALLLVLRRPNQGELPNWLERRIAFLPEWLRGKADAPTDEPLGSVLGDSRPQREETAHR